MSNEAMFHVGAAMIKYEYENLVRPGTRSLAVFDHKLRAFEIIRERLDKFPLVDDVTISAILHLPACEHMTSEAETPSLHWAAAVKLIEARRCAGLDSGSSLGGVYLDSFLAASTYVFGAMTDLNIPPPEIHEPPRCEATSTSTQGPSPQLPLGLQVLLDNAKVGNSMVALIPNLFESRTRVVSHNSDEDSSWTFPEVWPLCDHTPPSIAGEPHIEEIVHRALAIFTVRPFGPVAMVGFKPKLQQAVFRKLISKCVARRMQNEEAALYWSWVVLVGSLKTTIGDLSPRGQTLRDLQVQKFPEWSASSSISQQILQMFPHDDDFLSCHNQSMRGVRLK